MESRRCALTSWLALALLVLVSIPLLAPADAGAIPAFARKYQMSCTTCHAPYPRLKPYGEEFAARGFRMEPGKEPPRATYDTGDPLLSLPRDLPLAMRMEGYFSYKEGGAAEDDFEWPWVWKILSGGPIGTKVSYYVYFLIEEGDVVGLEDAYLQLNDLFGSGFDLLAGQFQVCDPLFKRELRLERYDYLIFKTRVGLVPVDLTYDRGIALARTLPGEVDFMAQVVNGNGIEPAAEDVSDFVSFDQDDWKSVALRAARAFGPVRLGAFGYWGRTEAEGLGVAYDNDTYYIGPDLVVDFKEVAQLNAEFLYREDDDPLFGGAGDLHCTRGGFAELHYFPQGQDGRWVVSGLYNKVASDDNEADRETISVTANHLIARNVRLLIEAGQDLGAKATRATVGLVAAY